MKKYSMSAAIRKKKIKTARKYHFTPTKQVRIMKIDNNKC